MFTQELAPVACSLTVSALIALLPLITIFIPAGRRSNQGELGGLGLAGGRRDPPTKTRPSDATAAIRLVCAGAPTSNVGGPSSILDRQGAARISQLCPTAIYGARLDTQLDDTNM